MDKRVIELLEKQTKMLEDISKNILVIKNILVMKK